MKFVAFAALVWLFTACSDTVPVTPADERAVMEVLLAEYAPPGAALRVSTQAMAYWGIQHHKWPEDPQLHAGLVHDFLDVNRDWPEHDAWVGEWGLGFVDLDEFFDGGDDLHEAYERLLRGPPACDGFVRISRPGFSDDGRQALVDVSKQGGPEVGWGAVYLLERTDDGWRIVEKLASWVS